MKIASTLIAAALIAGTLALSDAVGAGQRSKYRPHRVQLTGNTTRVGRGSAIRLTGPIHGKPLGKGRIELQLELYTDHTDYTFVIHLKGGDIAGSFALATGSRTSVAPISAGTRAYKHASGGFAVAVAAKRDHEIFKFSGQVDY